MSIIILFFFGFFGVSVRSSSEPNFCTFEILPKVETKLNQNFFETEPKLKFWFNWIG